MPVPSPAVRARTVQENVGLNDELIQPAVLLGDYRTAHRLAVIHQVGPGQRVVTRVDSPCVAALVDRPALATTNPQHPAAKVTEDHTHTNKVGFDVPDAGLAFD